MKTYITQNYKETQKIAQDFAKKLKEGDVVALYGDLGSGKTTFTQGLAKGLGIMSRIISPTFTIIREYKIGNKAVSAGNLYHIDLYRIEDQKGLDGLGLEEILSCSQNIVVVEWAERMGDLLPKDRINVKFEYLSENKRRIVINNYEKRN